MVTTYRYTNWPSLTLHDVLPIYLERSHVNAPLDDAESQKRARLFVRSQASALNGVGAIWAPKYRQATFGAFLTTQADAEKALDFAYRDVLAAFDAFLEQAPADRKSVEWGRGVSVSVVLGGGRHI